MKQAQAGLTIIEVLMAIALFGIVSAATLALLPNLFRLNANSRDDQALTLVAKAYFEGVQQRWTDPTNGRFAFQNDDAPPAFSSSFTPTGMACAPSGTVPLQNGTQKLVREVTLTCSGGGSAFSFTSQFGRPE